MGYGHLIRRSFDIVARRPYLWLLGFLAGAATSFNLSGNGPNSARHNISDNYTGPSWSALQTFWNANWEWIVGIAAVLVVVGIVLFILGCIATGGIIRAAIEHDADRDYRLGTAWRAGYGTAWRIAGLRILTALLAIVPGLLIGSLAVAAVVGVMTSAGMAAASFGLAAVLTFVISIVFWLALSVASQLAQRLVVLEDGHVAESLSTGFRMIRWHFKDVALGWLVLIALSIGVGIATAVLAVVAAIPGVALGFGGWAVGGATGVIVAGSFAAVFFVGVVLAATGAYSAYSSVYWTLLFRNVRALPTPAPRGVIAPAA
jgi:hypothetical protein